MSYTNWHWQRLWDALTGDLHPQAPKEVPILASLCFYSLTFILGRVFRASVHRWAPPTWRSYLCDLVTTFQLLACSLENGQLRKHYGNTAYLCVLCVVGLYSMLTIQDGSSANPATHVVSYLQGQQHSLGKVVLRVLAQLLGALLSYKYARLFWYLELTESHMTRFHQLHCLTDLNVPLALGLSLEYGGSVLDHLVWTNTLSKFHNTEMFCKCVFGAWLTLLNVDFTGWYLNPLNASNQTFGCHGSGLFEHVLVYWCGPLCGVVTGVWLQSRLKQWKRGQLYTTDYFNTVRSSQPHSKHQ